jgi:hypothetical protein
MRLLLLRVLLLVVCPRLGEHVPRGLKKKTEQFNIQFHVIIICFVQVGSQMQPYYKKKRRFEEGNHLYYGHEDDTPRSPIIGQ